MIDVAAKIARLPEMTLSELQMKWKQVFGETPPPIRNKQYVVQKLAYRIQELHYGGLDKPTRRRLEQYARGVNTRPDQKVYRPLAGTILTREWHGVEHRATVLEDGFEYNNIKYNSLSQIARKITGTPWSGPVFFGLKSKREGK
jgi:hypothetical protein